MRAAAFVLVSLTTCVAAIVACGGPTPAPQAPVAVAVSGVPSGAPPSVGDAGPTSTTTQSLGGGAAGTKLTPLATATDAGAPQHKGELGRTLDDIKAIIVSHRDEARACYDAALPNHPGIEGNLKVRWLIDPTGVVKDAELDTSDSAIVEPAVTNCVVAIVKKIHFNASPKGFETKASYIFNFHPHTRHSVMGEGN